MLKKQVNSTDNVISIVVFALIFGLVVGLPIGYLAHQYQTSPNSILPRLPKEGVK